MKMNRVMALWIMLYMITSHFLFAQESQSVQMMVPPPGGYEMLNEEGKTTFPFKLISNHVVIPVEVKGQPLNLILDTGMPLSGGLLFNNEKVEKLNLQYGGKAMVMGVGGEGTECNLATGITFNLPDITLPNQMVLVMDQDSSQSGSFENKDGIIGYTLFSRFVVYINYDEMEITLTEPDRFAYTETGWEFPIRIDHYPFLVCTANITGDGNIPIELVIDTGNGTALTLNTEAREDLVLPEQVIAYEMRSIGSKIDRLMGRIKYLELGPYIFTNCLSSFRTSSHEPPPPWAKEGALGQELLRRFNIIFNYKEEKIILEPNSHYDEAFEFNMAGIQFTRSESSHFEVSYVIPDSPASEAGLQSGDQIIEIDGLPADQLSSDDAEQRLREEGREVILNILREDEQMQVRLILRRLI